jgi:hypothetical protein
LACIFLICRARSASIHSEVVMDLIERGSVVSNAGDPVVLAVTGEIGAGADEVRLTGGLSASLASSFPNSFT